MSLLTGDDFDDEEIEHGKIKQAFQQGWIQHTWDNFGSSIAEIVGKI